ncbi:MAG TPA: HAMP domain-containing sensor histidine kinase [Mycobacteriales bacterium]|nr:HAMP domain-containing sensor histidine kinase [Mycobacteriales bacterium]
MSAIRSWRADPRPLFAGWVAFAAVNLLSMPLLPGAGVVAFHLVWISLAIVYGVQGWSTRRTAVMLAAVIAASGLSMGSLVAADEVEWPELSEVPLMAMVFLTMVWHVRRRTTALAQTQNLVERERRAQHVKELFVRNCSHEMRTPITVARGYAELVRGVLPTPASRDDMDVVVDELDKLGSLAGRLLVLADAYESAQFERAAVDLGVLVRRTVQRWRPAADRVWSVQAPSIVIEADESRLEAALDALVENAVKFTDDGDAIALRCRATRRSVQLEIEDSGIGFATSRAGGGRSGTASRAGTGLGLAIVRAIAEGHGGELWQAEERDRGALLRIDLPAAATAMPEVPAD